MLIKDNIYVSELHTTSGTLALTDNIAENDVHIVANLHCNGALILEKTNMTEFANHTGNNMPGVYSSRGGQVSMNLFNRESKLGLF
ncbi:hypothetical protein GOQ29_08675 [Clostridium sp. D2Q-14]|uniref:amidase family protein n=1 Tax=Anaeromonas gelatinilytica TaxID=2683194 RepID=UPI00193C80E7|nr:hypothetical protein [Anaeromonas gelatinilytica]